MVAFDSYERRCLKQTQKVLISMYASFRVTAPATRGRLPVAVGYSAMLQLRQPQSSGCLSPAAAGRLWASCAEPRPVTAELCAGGSRSSRESPWCSGGGSPVPSPSQNSSWGYTASAGRLHRCPLLLTDLRGRRGGGRLCQAFKHKLDGLSKRVGTKQDSKQDLILFSPSLYLTNSRSDPPHWSRSRYVSGYGGGLGRGCCLSCSRLLLHLPVALTKVEHLAGQNKHQPEGHHHRPTSRGTSARAVLNVEGWSFDSFPERQKDIFLKCHLRVMCGDPCRYLDVSAGVDFVNSISRGSTGLSVQIVALNKHCVVTQAAHPHVPLALTLKLNAFADVKPERGQHWVTGK